MTETWKPIILKGKSYDYEISTLGRVRNIRTGKILKPYKRGQRKGNYLCVALYKNGQRTVIDCHRLVALMFIPNPKNKPEVNHLDCDNYNPRMDNLEWCTREENERHKLFMMA